MPTFYMMTTATSYLHFQSSKQPLNAAIDGNHLEVVKLLVKAESEANRKVQTAVVLFCVWWRGNSGLFRTGTSLIRSGVIMVSVDIYQRQNYGK